MVRCEIVNEPPWSGIKDVVAKIKKDGAHGILVCPRWERNKWYKALAPLIRAKYVYEKGTKFYELHGETVRGARWDVTVAIFCGHDPMCPILEEYDPSKHWKPRPIGDRSRGSTPGTTPRKRGNSNPNT